MLLSKSCVYGLRAALYLSAKKDEFISIRDISEELNISFHFLTKILQQLTADGLMESYKGPNGGVRLSAKGRKATLLDIVISIDGPDLFTQCALGLPGCGSEDPCPLHENWVETRTAISTMLERAALEDIAQEAKQYQFRITAEGKYNWS